MAGDPVLPRYIGIGCQLAEREPARRAGLGGARFATGDDGLDQPGAALLARSQPPIGLTGVSRGALPIDGSRGDNTPIAPRLAECSGATTLGGAWNQMAGLGIERFSFL